MKFDIHVYQADVGQGSLNWCARAFDGTEVRIGVGETVQEALIILCKLVTNRALEELLPKILG